MSAAQLEDRRSLTERVRDALAERITSDRLRPGDRLPTERQLIEEFGVSRTVVRDAVFVVVLVDAEEVVDEG